MMPYSHRGAIGIIAAMSGAAKLITFFLMVPAFALGALEVSGIYFTETGCDHCDAFLYVGRARLEEKYAVTIELETHDVLSDEGYKLCVDMLAERGLQFTTFPVLFIGNNVYRGSGAIETNLPRELESYTKRGKWLDEVSEEEDQAPFVAGLVPVLLAGLLDGVNPCAFSTLMFFLSFVGLRKKRKEAVFLSGIAFISGVFVAYLFLGFGLLGALRAFLSERHFSFYLNCLISAVAAALMILNVKDAMTARRGLAEDSILKMPGFLRRADHLVIRRFTALPAAIAGAAIAGILVSFIELACTGQIYLPTLAYLNRTAFSSRGFSLLIVYNLAFITPLGGVFVLYYFGLTHGRIQEWYRRRIALVRMLSAAFFLSMAILVWIV